MECDNLGEYEVPSAEAVAGSLRNAELRKDLWMEVLPKGIRKALVDSIALVEGGSVPTGLHLSDLEAFRAWERCGLLYWWPTEWDAAKGEWVVELRSMQVPNELRSVDEFGIDPVRGYGIQESVAVECSRLRGDLSAMPFVFFGTWHTHPSGANEISPQDLLAEGQFDVWRNSMGSFQLGMARSFVFGMDGALVSSVLSYTVNGPTKSWTRN